MKHIKAWWTKYWFNAAPPARLGLCRIIFYAGLLCFFWRREFADFVEFRNILWFPQTIFFFFTPDFSSETAMKLLTVIWKISLFSCCIGFMTRFFSLFAFALAAILLGFENNFGFIYHNDAPALIILGILALSKMGDYFSIDWYRKGRPTLQGSGEYHWPMQLIGVFIVLVYFSAGISKLYTANWNWSLPGNMARLILSHQVTHLPPTTIGVVIIQYKFITMMMAKLGLALELSCPMSLFFPRLRKWLLPALFMMQLGIYIILGLKFYSLMLSFCFFLPWEKLMRLAPTTRRPASH